jgi:hypothetical protein
MPNAELAYRVLDHITAHPKEWNQTIYLRKDHCGTAACFAGWTVLLSGDRPNWSEGWPAHGGEVTDVVTAAQSPDSVCVSDRATELLDITSWDAFGLFDANNSMDDLCEQVVDIFGPRPA